MNKFEVFKLINSAAFLVSATLMVLYWVALHNINDHVCIGSTYLWANVSKYYLVISTITLLAIVILNLFFTNIKSSTRKTLLWLLFFPNLGFLVHIVGTFITFHRRKEQCPLLADFFTSSMFISILICASPLIICLVLCMSEGVRGFFTLLGLR